MRLTKAIVRQKLGIRFDKDLAKVLGITQGAVAQWGEHDPIPMQRVWQLQALRPDLFGSKDVAKKARRT